MPPPTLNYEEPNIASCGKRFDALGIFSNRHPIAHNPPVTLAPRSHRSSATQ